MTKQLLSLFLALTMLFSLGVPAFASEQTEWSAEDTALLPEEHQEDFTDYAPEPEWELNYEDTPAEIIQAEQVAESEENGETGIAMEEAAAYEAEDIFEESMRQEEQPFFTEPVLEEDEEEAAFSYPDVDEEHSGLDEDSYVKEDSIDQEGEVRVVFELNPSWAKIHVYKETDGYEEEIYPEEDSSFYLVPGAYKYSASAEGYVAAEEVEFTLYGDVVYLNSAYEDVREPIEISLIAYPEEEVYESISVTDIPQQEEYEYSAEEPVFEAAPEEEVDEETVPEPEENTAFEPEEVTSEEPEESVPEEPVPYKQNENEIPDAVEPAEETAAEESAEEAGAGESTEPFEEIEAERVEEETVAEETEEEEDGQSSKGGFLKWLFTGKSPEKTEEKPEEEEIEKEEKDIDLLEAENQETVDFEDVSKKSDEEIKSVTISSVSVTMSEPYKGDSPDLSPSVPEDAPYTVFEVKWFEEDGTLISYPEQYTFQSGKVIIAILLHANSGYTFSTGSMTATVNGNPNTYDFYSDGYRFLFYFTFDVSESYQSYHGKPVFSSEPTNQTAATGSYVQFECILKKFTVGTTLTWEYRTSSAGTWTVYETKTLPVSSDSGSVYCDSISLQASEEMNGYQYRVKAENEYGIVSSAIATLTVTTSTKLPKITATTPEDKEALAGNKISLSVSFTNYDSATTVAWYYREPGGSWTQCTSPTYNIYHAISYGRSGLEFTVQQSMDGYQFYCTVTNATGSSDSRVATLRIVSCSQVEVTITAPEAGAYPSYVVGVPSDANYSVNLYSSGNYLNGVAWQNGTTEGYLNPKAIASRFFTGIPYRVYIYLNAADGYVFSEQITATVNGKVAEIESLTETSGTVQISYLFPAVSEKSGWQKEDGKWYYFEDGVAVTGWKQISGKWYYFESGGAMVTGWKQLGSKWYYFESSGAMVTGWKQLGGKWYYFESGGAMATGWKQISGKWYYFESGGAMVTGWKQLSSKWYYFESSGAMATGWKQLGGKWYYFESGGAMATGWKQISGKWYYFESGGAMVTGWKQLSSKWYYFESSGAMATGWKQLGGKWYYFESSGAMATGWKQLGGKWYYFGSSGAMLANTSKTIGGKTYNFDANGVCTNP